jgi:hypothetical protein
VLVTNIAVDRPFFDSPGQDVVESPEGRCFAPFNKHTIARMRLYIKVLSPWKIWALTAFAGRSSHQLRRAKEWARQYQTGVHGHFSCHFTKCKQCDN